MSKKEKNDIPDFIYWNEIPLISKNFLLITSILRIILSIFILFYTSFPPYLKVLSVILLDFIDCNTGFWFNIYPQFYFCKTSLYQNTDKMVDLISYLLIFLYVFSCKFFSDRVNLIILLVFSYRLVGMYLFERYRDRKYLILFPNFGPELVLILLVFLAFPGVFEDNWLKMVVIMLFVMWKIINELAIHYDDKMVKIKYEVKNK